jgi:selenide,water dikinase
MPADPNLLVGTETSDDAAVYRLTPDLALVQTVDYITPLVDDPFAYGQIAAANALSDLYAMGARPILALNIVAFPATDLPLDILSDILRGGLEKAREAGVTIGGGHSVDDREPKYGLAVTGVVHPDAVLRNSTARPGDCLILTKPLGMGIVSTAIKRDLAPPELMSRAVAIMSALNRAAAEAVAAVGAHACTDVTGFGLLGHLHEMTAGSRVGARIALHQIPVLPEVWGLARDGAVPGGSRRNLAFAESFVQFAPEIPAEARLVLADAQTSGGLLIAVPERKCAALLAALRDQGVAEMAEIGVILDDPPGAISVVP